MGAVDLGGLAQCVCVSGLVHPTVLGCVKGCYARADQPVAGTTLCHFKNHPHFFSLRFSHADWFSLSHFILRVYGGLLSGNSKQ